MLVSNPGVDSLSFSCSKNLPPLKNVMEERGSLPELISAEAINKPSTRRSESDDGDGGDCCDDGGGGDA
ncbi:hypothetical protein RUM43_004356 [Polyplax serrata]|uniref:Uncharacterized protein n=1 Tax=Polyplax serrata TaxID=468196 RepID=A0AAN8SBJ1_POLSC